MIKYLLNLFASSASVLVLLMAANFTFISYHHVANHVSHTSIAETQIANLNLASPILGLTNSNQHIIAANLGCSCLMCTQLSQSSMVNS